MLLFVAKVLWSVDKVLLSVDKVILLVAKVYGRLIRCMISC